MKCTRQMRRQGVCDRGKFANHASSVRAGAYNQTTLWIDNEQPLYNQKWAFYKNYCRKMVKGKFDRNLAKKGFRHLIEQANKVHKQQIGEAIPLDDRRVAENILVKSFFIDVNENGGCEKIAGYKSKKK